jgi:predicted secreted protein
MAYVSGFVLFFLLWWMAWFVVLPFGNARGENATIGHAASAPVRPRLCAKILAATWIAALLWAPAHYGFIAVLDHARAQAIVMSVEDHNQK